MTEQTPYDPPQAHDLHCECHALVYRYRWERDRMKEAYEASFQENQRMRAVMSMFSAGVSVDAPHATSVDGDASHTSTAPAEPPQPTRPDPGITERKPRR